LHHQFLIFTPLDNYVYLTGAKFYILNSSEFTPESFSLDLQQGVTPPTEAEGAIEKVIARSEATRQSLRINQQLSFEKVECALHTVWLYRNVEGLKI